MTEESTFSDESKKIPLSPWWKGARGEWYVLAQLVFFALVAFGPRTWPGAPVWMAPYTTIGIIVGGVLILFGAVLLFSGINKLGANITPVPYPKENGTLVETGPYALVRHPLYSGGIMMAFGWALFIHGWLTIGYAFVLFAFFDLKSRREEQWLLAKFSAYAAYQRRVRKLIPFIY